MTRGEYIKWLKLLDEELTFDGLVDGEEEVDLHIMIFDLCEALKQEPKTGHCKDCKWWKDSDGAYRRGVGAESQCPINRKEVFEGNGYCYMFEPQESEE